MVGGRKGVGVEAGEQAERKKRVRIRVANRRLAVKGKRPESCSIKKGRPIGSPQKGNYNSSSAAPPPPSDSTPISNGRAISPLRAFCLISVSISFIRSGF